MTTPTTAPAERIEALVCANWIEGSACGGSNWNKMAARTAAELRRLHAVEASRAVRAERADEIEHLLAAFESQVRDHERTNHVSAEAYLKLARSNLLDAIRAATHQPQAVRAEPERYAYPGDRKLLEALDRYINPVLQELQFERGTGSLAAHNLRLCLIEVGKALKGERERAETPGVGFPLQGVAEYVTAGAPLASHQPQAAESVAAVRFCTCDGAGRGPGRPCSVKAGNRLGDAWTCREQHEARRLSRQD